jgi:Asp-tRNA(Asn)/Glu-tRNA(Gln) amidotransferase A subunit family amidase
MVERKRNPSYRTQQEPGSSEANIMTTPAMRPYFPATEKFADGGDSPRAFLERCLESLEAWEPSVGAFVALNLEAARAAADESTKRWRGGHQISPIDGMPVGIKDIIETADMPTQNGSPLFDGFRSDRDGASVVALREAGAVIVGKTVTTEFASTEPRGTKNPLDTARTPGGSSSGSAAAVAMGAISAGIGTQVLGSILRPSSFCGCFGFKPTVGVINRGGSYDGLSQSTHGPITATLPEAWRVAWEISQRAGGDPGFPGLYGRPEAPGATKPEKLAFVETDGWEVATDGARLALEEVIARLRTAGIAVATRVEDDQVAAIETAIHGAKELSISINTWESRWPLNTYKARDAGKLSRHMLERSSYAESMTLDNYRHDVAVREELRGAWQKLVIEFDACITLAAPGAAPVGHDFTGDPVFNAPASLLGIPALSLPVLSDEGLPLGLQLMGFPHRDAALFGTAAWVMEIM